MDAYSYSQINGESQKKRWDMFDLLISCSVREVDRERDTTILLSDDGLMLHNHCMAFSVADTAP